MAEKECRRESIDLKLTAILFVKKLWFVLLWACIGAVLSGGIYFLAHVVYAPAREYEAVSKLYLEFATDDDGDAYQYYNGYTWNDLMGTEPVLDTMMGLLSGMEREKVREAVAADILSDIRVLTVTVTTHDSKETEAIIRAAEEALIQFGQKMQEFEEIRVIEHGQTRPVMIENETVRAVLLGAVGGIILCLLGLWFACVLDDSIYLPYQFELRYGYPAFGVRFAEEKGKDRQNGRMAESRSQVKYAQQEFSANIDYLLKGKNPVYVAIGQEKEVLPDYDKLRNSDGIILEIPYGMKNGKWIERQISQFKKQDCEILGAVLTEAEKGVYRLYYAGKRNR